MGAAYYAVIHGREAGLKATLSPKVNSSQAAVDRVLGEHALLPASWGGLKHDPGDSSTWSVQLLATRKPQAITLFEEVKNQVRERARLFARAEWEGIHERVIKTCREAVQESEERTEKFVSSLLEGSGNLGHFLSRGSAGPVIEDQVRAQYCKHVLDMVESKGEDPVDALFGVLQHASAAIQNRRFEGDQHFWRTAVHGSEWNALTRVVSGFGGLVSLLWAAEACQRARKELGVSSPPWSPVDLGYVIPALARGGDS